MYQEEEEKRKSSKLTSTQFYRVSDGKISVNVSLDTFKAGDSLVFNQGSIIQKSKDDYTRLTLPFYKE